MRLLYAAPKVIRGSPPRLDLQSRRKAGSECLRLDNTGLSLSAADNHMICHVSVTSSSRDASWPHVQPAHPCCCYCCHDWSAALRLSSIL